jgi:hypothetical protein
LDCGTRKYVNLFAITYPVVCGCIWYAEGSQTILQSLYQCLASVAQLYDNRTVFKTHQRIPNTASILLQSRLGRVSSVTIIVLLFLG